MCTCTPECYPESSVRPLTRLDKENDACAAQLCSISMER